MLVARRVAPLAALACAALWLTGCAARPVAEREWTVPPPDAAVDYQIGGAYPPPSGVAVVSRDRSDAALAGAYSICYVNAFQTQSQDLATVWTAATDLLLPRPGVEVPATADPTEQADVERYWVVDSQWQEIVLDISTEATRHRLLDIVGPWIDDCARKGFQAVEPDNLDSYDRNADTRRLLTREDAAAMARMLSARAHAAGLAIAQKNAADLLDATLETGFDFAVVEECQEFAECGDYMDRYGESVIVIEYTATAFDAACDEESIGPRVSVVLRDQDVRPAGSSGYRYATC